jgi:transcriptional regulator with XRE-family HTH domain
MAEARTDFGRWLEGQRVGRSLSKRGAATVSGLHESLWATLEAGGRVVHGRWIDANPTLATLVKVAKALDLPPSEVAAAAGVDVPPGIDDSWTRRQEQQHLAELALESMSPEVREAIERMIEQRVQEALEALEAERTTATDD